MDLVMEETNFSTLAALSASINCKSDTKYSQVNQHVQTEKDYTKRQSIVSSDEVNNSAFQNLPSCSPVDIQFKDLSYHVQRAFSKSEY